jgi:cytochrome c-type biogenesis protein CcmF
MGVVPLTMWGASTAGSLAKPIWIPAMIALAATVIALMLGLTSWVAPLSICFVFFAVIATLMDTFKSILLRARTHSESGWKAFGSLVRHNRRRYGGYLIHIGVALMGLGIIGIEMFQTTTQGMVAEGESLQLSGYTFTYEELEIYDTPDGRNIATASILISRNGRELGRVFPGSDYYYYAQQSVTKPGIRSTLSEDLYIVLVDWLEITSEGANFKVFRNPLINWLWIGTAVLILGTLVALWPVRERKPRLTSEEVQA